MLGNQVSSTLPGFLQKTTSLKDKPNLSFFFQNAYLNLPTYLFNELYLHVQTKKKIRHSQFLANVSITRLPMAHRMYPCSLRPFVRAPNHLRLAVLSPSNRVKREPLPCM